MKHSIKFITVLIVVISLQLTSCHSYRSISKRSPVTEETLAKLKPGKEYQFVLRIGETQTIYITNINADTIKGYVYQGGKSIKNRNTPSVSSTSGQVVFPEAYLKETKTAYADSRENVLKNVVKITERKADPLKTAALIMVPAGVIFGLWALSHLPF